MKGRLQGVLIAGTVLLLAGCAGQPQYKMVKKDATSQERYQDNAQCQMQANYVQVADFEYRGTFMEGVNIKQKQQQTYQLCMSSLGYSAVRVQ